MGKKTWLASLAAAALSFMVAACGNQGTGGGNTNTSGGSNSGNTAGGSTATSNAAGGSGSSGNHRTYTLGVAIANMPDPFYVSEYYGMVQEAQKEGNIKLLLADAGGYTQVAKQVSQLQNFMTQNVDAVLLAATSPSGTKAVVEQLNQHHIPVINFTSATDGPVVTYIGSSQQQLGEDQAKTMIELLGGKGNVVMLPGPAGVSWAIDRAQAFKNYIQAHSSIQIVKEEWEDSSPTAGYNTMANLLRAIPNIDGVYTGSDFLGDGAVDAIKAAGKGGKIVVTTAVLEPQTLTYIKSGLLQMTAAQRAVTIGETAVKAAIDVLNGKTVPKTISVPDMIVTSKNVDSVDMSQIMAPAGFKP
ncbi:MAG: sugar ABC transporter substrate-binding protein [Alicyclobacillus sp.]|nr:sugar ABC transporter substrate-binding protein [Alicyclobacillus sp.]